MIRHDDLGQDGDAGATAPRINGARVFGVRPGSPFLFAHVRIINPHDHGTYDFLPRWKHTKLFEERYQWQKDSDYKGFKGALDLSVVAIPVKRNAAPNPGHDHARPDLTHLLFQFLQQGGGAARLGVNHQLEFSRRIAPLR